MVRIEVKIPYSYSMNGKQLTLLIKELSETDFLYTLTINPKVEIE